MKYGFEISDFSATIYNIISANFTINLAVNVRGWGQNEQIVTKYRSWCRGSNNGVDGLQSAAPPTGHTEDERQEEKCDVLAGHSASKYGMSYRRALESLDWGQSPPLLPPWCQHGVHLHTAVVQFRSETFLWSLVDNINPLNSLNGCTEL